MSESTQSPVIKYSAAHNFFTAYPFSKNIIAGGTAGITELFIMYPLDVVKTRFQVNATVASKAGGPSPLISAIKEVFLNNKKFYHIYRGIAFPILSETPKRAIKFAGNTYVNSKVEMDNLYLKAFWCGLLTGWFEGAVVSSPELIKIRLQIPANRSLYTNSAQCMSHIIKTEGLRCLLTRGLIWSAWRNGMWNGTYFGLVYTMKRHVEFFEQNTFISGIIAGVIATGVNTPFDTVKSRVQNQIGKSVLPGYKVAYNIIELEGIRALWKGFIPKVMRLGPGGGIMLVVYNRVVELLSAV